MTPALFHAERLHGCCEAVQSFARWWSSSGPFALVVAINGGLRTNASLQQSLFDSGHSRARTLAETAHGRGAAGDFYPAVVVGGSVAGIVLPTTNAEALERFAEFGGLAESHGLEWGGRWRGFPDFPHVEAKDWRLMPWPPVISPPYPPP